MTDQNTREIIEQYLQAISEQNTDGLMELLHDDFIEEYPQSGERIKGKRNLRKVYDNFEGMPDLQAYNLHVQGDLALVETLLEYPKQGTYLGSWIIELSNGKIKRNRAYFAAPFEAPKWRSKWVEMMGEPADQGFEEVSRPGA